MANDLKQICKKYNLVYKLTFEKNKSKLIIYSSILSKLLEKIFNKYAKHKTIPINFLHFSKKSLKVLVKSMAIGDGYWDTKTKITYTTMSNNVAHILNLILLKIGYFPHLSRKTRGEYTIIWDEKREIKWSIANYKNKYVYSKINKINKIKYSGLVYDIEVEKEHSFLTSSFIIHNCMPIAEAGASLVPAIGVDHSAITEVIGEGGLLVKPKAFTYTQSGTKYYFCTPKDLAKTIKKFFKLSEDKKSEMRKKARNFALTLKPELIAKQMLNAFDRIIKNDITSLAKG